MIMTGDRIDAVTAHAVGILQRVFPASTFDADVLAYAERLAAGPPHALALIKAGLQTGQTEALEQTFAFERLWQSALFSEPDCLAGLQSFLEKRRPRFGGAS